MSNTFKATALPNFREGMIAYWMENESMTRDDAMEAYAGSDFDNLCEAVKSEREYFMDQAAWKDGKPNGLSETECFELQDDNFVIPVSLLIKAEDA